MRWDGGSLRVFVVPESSMRATLLPHSPPSCKHSDNFADLGANLASLGLFGTEILLDVALERTGGLLVGLESTTMSTIKVEKTAE
jgi:hypothetical protein